MIDDLWLVAFSAIFLIVYAWIVGGIKIQVSCEFKFTSPEIKK